VAGAARLHQRMPGSAVHTLPEAGHLLLMESADAAADRYIPFLRRVRP
jgi:pimeloyl-ACP methyl ester carboxylesterase